MLELKKVQTAYGQSQVLFGVDLQVNDGEVVTLLGRNGMGKTTTIHSIMFTTPTFISRPFIIMIYTRIREH